VNIQQLRYAKAVADLGSFVQAAARCCVTQPTLSNAIAQLELELGHKLFHRTTRSVRMTPEGAQLLPDICDLLNTQEVLVARARALSNPQRCVIRVGVSPIVGVKRVTMVIEAFHQANPNVEIIFRELNLAEMLRLLDIGQIDFAFGPSDPMAESQLGYQAAFFQEEPLVFVPNSRTKASYLGRQSVGLRDIVEETFVMVPDACGLTKSTRALFAGHGLALKEYSGHAMSYSVLQDWADLGIGSSILPQSKLLQGTTGAIPIATHTGAAVQIRYHCVWRQNDGLASQIVLFAEFLRHVAPLVAQGLSQ
jgi:LysR family transcriptional regulator, hydrogen peroxide-inducible genes activator